MQVAVVHLTQEEITKLVEAAATIKTLQTSKVLGANGVIANLLAPAVELIEHVLEEAK